MACHSTQRMIADAASDARAGTVVWSPVKSVWTGSVTVIALVGGPLYFTADAFLLFLVTSAITLCGGHSVGMHRLLIHRGFEAPKWLEHILVYLGTLMGMAGPRGMIYGHDIRDWAQRQETCHDLFGHRRSFLHDAWWQMHCEVRLDHPPCFVLEPAVAQDRFYGLVERTWLWQQLPWSVGFFLVGGLPWLIWGLPVRVAVSLTGHWLVGHFAHRGGHQGWRVEHVAVQGYNIRHIGLITFGECWHANHHAFPGSAKLGLEPGQVDPGWWLIRLFQFVGLARNPRLPEDLPVRANVVRAALRPQQQAGIELEGPAADDGQLRGLRVGRVEHEVARLGHDHRGHR